MKWWLWFVVFLLVSLDYVDCLNGAGPKVTKPKSDDDAGALRPSPFDGFLRSSFFSKPVPEKPSVGGGLIGGFNLADGAELIIPSIKTGFSCFGRIYGYYADVDNDCRIFHVCNPVENGFPQQFSFFCGNQTSFNQKTLTCDYESNVDCGEAPSYYALNEKFGKD